MRFGRITELWRYPVSSLGGERLEAAELDAAGVHGDRLWGLMDRESGEVAYPEKRRRWRPTPELKARLEAAGPAISRDGAAWLPVGGEEAAQLAAGHLGFPVALRPHVRFGETAEGKVAPRYARRNLHLLTSASLRQLQALLPEGARTDTRRFRPNLVVETAEDFEGFVEAELVGRTLAIGAARLSVIEPCMRCAFTTLSQDDLPLDPAILQAIARAGGGAFGAYCSVVVPATLRLGDEVLLEEE